MKKVALIIGLILSIFLTLFLFPDKVQAASTQYSALNTLIGFSIPYLTEILGALNVIFWHDYSYTIIGAWILIGLVVGAATRKGSTGFSYGFYMATLIAAILYVIAVTIYDSQYLPYTPYGEFNFIVYFVYPAVVNGVLCGFGGMIGGRVTKKGIRGLSEKEIQELIQKAERVCPKCGAKIDSSAIFCSNCGYAFESKEIEPPVEKMIEVEGESI